MIACNISKVLLVSSLSGPNCQLTQLTPGLINNWLGNIQHVHQTRFVELPVTRTSVCVEVNFLDVTPAGFTHNNWQPNVELRPILAAGYQMTLGCRGVRVGGSLYC